MYIYLVYVDSASYGVLHSLWYVYDELSHHKVIGVQFSACRWLCRSITLSGPPYCYSVFDSIRWLLIRERAYIATKRVVKREMTSANILATKEETKLCSCSLITPHKKQSWRAHITRAKLATRKPNLERKTGQDVRTGISLTVTVFFPQRSSHRTYNLSHIDWKNLFYTHLYLLLHVYLMM
jgi:hypothetical protein